MGWGGRELARGRGGLLGKPRGSLEGQGAACIYIHGVAWQGSDAGFSHWTRDNGCPVPLPPAPLEAGS